MTKEQLWKDWSYEFQEWIKTLQSAPVELIKSYDWSRSYEMERGHIFKLENNQYALIIEHGCSCYSPSWASIEVFPDLEKAQIKFDEAEKEDKKGYDD